MKRTLLSSVLSVLVITSSSAIGINQYVSAKFGYDLSYSNKFIRLPSGNMDIKKAYGLSGLFASGILFDVDPFVSIRLEAEYSYSNTKVKEILDVNNNDTLSSKEELPINKFLANAYIDLGDKSFIIKPYIGFGAGYGYGSYKDGNEEKIKGFAWMGTFGATYSFNKNISVDLGLRYSKMVAKNLKLKGPVAEGEINLNPISVSLGGKYKF